MKKVLRCSLFAATVLFSGLALAQPSPPADWAAAVADRYQVFPDITYLTAERTDLKLDLYEPRNAASATPTAVYIHGGGWVRGSKNRAALRLLPYLEMGWAVVNVEYRLANVSPAPAAVEDCRCALRWVIAHAEQYHFDRNKIVLTGHSAGGHLALLVGMLPAATGLNGHCPGREELKVAAIVNWFGITDVADLLSGPHERDYAVEWLDALPNREQMAKRLSPLNYVRAGLPPIITIHGDADPTVPYSQAVRLHEALGKVGVPNQLVTIHGGGHGRFPPDEDARAYRAIQQFLAKYHVTKTVTGGAAGLGYKLPSSAEGP